MLTCKTCSAALDVTMSTCPSCGAEVPLGRLTGMLGIVCRACDAYNDPGARTCMACGKPLGVPESKGHGAAKGAKARSHAAPPAAAPVAQPAAPAPEPGPEPDPAPVAAPVEKARLFVERGEAAVGTVFRIAGPETPAGSAQPEVAFPRDPSLAPLHVSFVVRDDAVVLRDEGAAGGVYVRLRGLTVPLRPGALFALGDRLLRFAGPLGPVSAPAHDGTQRLGAPRPDGTAILVEEWLEGGVPGRSYVRGGPSITIGRTGCSINLGDDPFVSQAHAELLVDADGGARLRDLGSSNGTFVRLPPGSERELNDGDRIRMGREVLRVELGS